MFANYTFSHIIKNQHLYGFFKVELLFLRKITITYLSLKQNKESVFVLNTKNIQNQNLTY